MRSEPFYLTTSLIVRIHRRMLAEFGGDPGLRDRGLLEAAATMPRATFDCVFLHDGIPEMAAAYHYHLSQNHPFVDGNKRVALAAALVFLSLNELALDATDDELEGLASGLAEGRPDKSDVARFYRGKAV